MDFTWQSVYKLEFLVQQCMPSAVIFYYYLRFARRHLYIFLGCLSPFSSRLVCVSLALAFSMILGILLVSWGIVYIMLTFFPSLIQLLHEAETCVMK